MAPQQSWRVTRVLVHEGQNVTVGRVLCELDADVEPQALRVAMSSVRELEARLDLVLDQLKKKEPLSRKGVTSELDHSQMSLQAELLRKQIATARAEAGIEFSQKILEAERLRMQVATADAEVELKRRQLDTLILRSPIDGFLYIFDVRPGEHLTPQDYPACAFRQGFAIPRVYQGRYPFLGSLQESRCSKAAFQLHERFLDRLDTMPGQVILWVDVAPGTVLLRRAPRSGRPYGAAASQLQERALQAPRPGRARLTTEAKCGYSSKHSGAARPRPAERPRPGRRSSIPHPHQSRARPRVSWLRNRRARATGACSARAQ